MNTFFLLLLSFLWTSYNQEEIKIYAINAKSQTTQITAGGTIKTQCKPFSLQIEAYKNADLAVQLYATFDKKVYDSALQNPNLSELEVFDANNTMAVAIVGQVADDHVLRINNESVQGYIHESNAFTSFDTIDSTENTVLVTKKLNTFIDMSGTYFSDSLQYDFKKARRKKVYCVLKCEAEIYKSGAASTIPFVIET